MKERGEKFDSKKIENEVREYLSGIDLEKQIFESEEKDQKIN